MAFEINDIVVVTRGKHEGFLGFIDDEIEDGRFVLYDLTPQRIFNGYIVVGDSDLRKLTEEEVLRLTSLGRTRH